MSNHRAAPLTADEARVLRALAQDLTRCSPDLLRESGRDDPSSRPALVELGVYLLAIGLIVGLITVTVGPLLAIVVGAALLVAATIKAATSARVDPSRR